MPELLTAHPDTVKSMLGKMGARCGKGSPQEILKACPKGSFCAIPGVGEFCVLGLNQKDKLTQFGFKEKFGFNGGKGRTWWIWLLVIAGVVIIIFLLWFLMRKK